MRKLWCFLFGHDWGDEWYYFGYHKTCRTCHLSVYKIDEIENRWIE